jgi:hypothetical protein
MGWCSGTSIFDDVLRAALPHITDKAARERFVYQVAVTLWEGDWDCEGDSDYYQEFQHILDAGEDSDKPWAKDPVVAAKFPPVKTYRKTYVTPAIEYTGYNFHNVRAFCEGDGGHVWGIADINDTYGNTRNHPASTMNELCVYDYLRRAWIPFSVGDHIAKGSTGEHYPIGASVLKTDYVEVTLT